MPRNIESNIAFSINYQYTTTILLLQSQGHIHILLCCIHLKVVKDIVGPRPMACGHALYYVFNACNMLVVLNSSSNFVIYYVMRRRFRRILLEKMCGLRAHIRHGLHSFRMSTNSGELAAHLAAGSNCTCLSDADAHNASRQCRDTVTGVDLIEQDDHIVDDEVKVKDSGRPESPLLINHCTTPATEDHTRF